MLSLGLDLSERSARALVVDEQGTIVGRGSGDTAAAAVHAATAGHQPDRAGIAAEASDKTDVTGFSSITRSAPGAAAVAAEAWLGAAKGVSNAICLHIGDEVFAGVILDGRPWAGAHNRSGAAAWLAINPVERQDYRRRGSLAAEVSALGIARRLSWRIQAGDESRVLDAAGGSLDAITGHHVFDGARAGDGVAISVVRDTAKYIGMAIASLVATVDPELVVVSGSVAVQDLMLDAVRQECARRLPPDAMNDLRVEFSMLGDDEVAIGAARLALDAK